MFKLKHILIHGHKFNPESTTIKCPTYFHTWAIHKYIHVHGLLKPLENRNNIHEISWAYPSVNSGSSILWRVEQVVHRHGARTLWAPMDCWKATPTSEPEIPHFECRLAQVNNETRTKPHETAWNHRQTMDSIWNYTWNYVIKNDEKAKHIQFSL